MKYGDAKDTLLAQFHKLHKINAQRPVDLPARVRLVSNVLKLTAAKFASPSGKINIHWLKNVNRGRHREQGPQILLRNLLFIRKPRDGDKKLFLVSTHGADADALEEDKRGWALIPDPMRDHLKALHKSNACDT